MRTRLGRIVSTTQTIVYYLIVFLLFCLAIGLAALVLSSILFHKYSDGEICNNCEGMVGTVLTDNATLSPIINQTLKIFGALGIETTVLNLDEITISADSSVCNNCSGMVNTVITNTTSLSPIINQTLKIFGISGIMTSIENVDEITINNLRDLSPYIVSDDGLSEYLTPQDAYTQAVADGRGLGNPAIILIAPGYYDFGSTLFDVLVEGISFVGLAGTSDGFTSVYFTASSIGGGIHVDVPPTPANGAVFKGITFGLENDATGFLISLTSGQMILDECTAPVSNFRITLNGNPTNTSMLNVYSCAFYLLASGDDFITTLSNATSFTIENSRIHDIGTGTPGNYIINIEAGANRIKLHNANIVSAIYTSVFKGPLSGNNASIFVEMSRVNMMPDTPAGSFLLHTGSFNLYITSSNITTQGPLLYQLTDGVDGDLKNLYSTNNDFVSNGFAVVENDAAVTIIGQCDYKFFNGILRAINDPYVIQIPGASGSDLMQVLLFSIAVESTAAPLGDYAISPATFSFIRIGSSVSVNGATTANGFVSTPLQVI